MKYSDVKKTISKEILGIEKYDDFRKYEFLAMHISEAKSHLMNDNLTDKEKLESIKECFDHLMNDYEPHKYYFQRQYSIGGYHLYDSEPHDD